MSPLPALRAVVLVSGGLDSAVTLGLARTEGRSCTALTFDYGQRHRAELDAAAAVARSLSVERHIVLPLDLRAIGGSALTADIDVPKDRAESPAGTHGIPITYVPARNLVFLSIAAGLAEVINAPEIWIGVNAVDFSGYPDCRPKFIESFQQTARLGTRAGAEGHGVTIRTPLIDLPKRKIIQLAHANGVDLGLTLSCYDPKPIAVPCGHCDACLIRAEGFRDAGLADPARH